MRINNIAAILLLVTATLVVVRPGEAAVRVYRASITHEQEVSDPPIPDEGSSGRGVFVLNDDNPASPFLTYNVKLTGLDLANQTPGNANDNVTRTHFHRAAFGINGGIIYGQIDGNPALRNDLDDLLVDPVAGTIRGRWDNAEGNGTTLLAQINDGAFNIDANNRTSIYFNVHTADHTGGEVRGQLTLVPEPATLALCVLGAVPLFARRRRK
jgi:hypothetical protein